jgi:hypothetical protein
LNYLKIWGGLIKNLVQHEIGSFGEGIEKKNMFPSAIGEGVTLLVVTNWKR